MPYGLPWSEQFIEELSDKELRDEYVSDRVRTRIALHIRALREQRGWTQSDLAERSNKKQSVISRIEDPDYEGIGLQSLFDVAAAFDLPLFIDLPEWDDWARRSKQINTAQLQRQSFDGNALCAQARNAAESLTDNSNSQVCYLDGSNGVDRSQTSSTTDNMLSESGFELTVGTS